MSTAGEVDALLERLTGRWYEPSGLTAALVIALVVSSWLPVSWLLKLSCFVFLGILSAGAWLWARRPPRAAKNRVGIAIAIVTSQTPAERTFASDFVSELRILLGRGRVGHTFQVVVAPQHVAGQLNAGDGPGVATLRSRMRCSFILAGSVRVRKWEGRDHLVLDLIGGVGHRPINEVVQRQFASEL